MMTNQLVSGEKQMPDPVRIPLFTIHGFHLRHCFDCYRNSAEICDCINCTFLCVGQLSSTSNPCIHLYVLEFEKAKAKKATANTVDTSV